MAWPDRLAAYDLGVSEFDVIGWYEIVVNSTSIPTISAHSLDAG